MSSFSSAASSSHKTLWVFLSMVVFIVVELFFGGIVGKLVIGRFVSHALYLRLQMFLMLGSYFSGGLLVGLLSPDIRILEPAIGAAIAVVMTFAYAFFDPSWFYRFSWNRALIGGAIAFVLALVGADAGERLAAKLGNQASRYYARQ
jgi:hypothetical protein